MEANDKFTSDTHESALSPWAAILTQCNHKIAEDPKIASQAYYGNAIVYNGNHDHIMGIIVVECYEISQANERCAAFAIVDQN